MLWQIPLIFLLSLPVALLVAIKALVVREEAIQLTISSSASFFFLPSLNKKASIRGVVCPFVRVSLLTNYEHEQLTPPKLIQKTLTAAWAVTVQAVGSVKLGTTGHYCTTGWLQEETYLRPGQAPLTHWVDAKGQKHPAATYPLDAPSCTCWCIL